MKVFLVRIRIFIRNFLIFLAVVGPGIITANVDNDAGGIATYSVAGARFGYSTLWIFVPMILVLIVIQEMTSRMGVVTGKGLADLIREKFGVRVTFYAMAVLILSNLGNTMAEFSGIAASGEIFGVSRFVTVPLAAAFVWWLVVKGTYKSVEKVFLVACFFYVSYIVSGFLIRPSWQEVLNNVASPSFRFDSSYLFILIGLIGTTIAPWMQFYQQSAVVEKGINVKDYRYARLDVIIGSFIVNIVAFFIVMVCAATLFKNGIAIESAKDAALAGEIGDVHVIKITSRDPEAPPLSYVKSSGGIFVDMTIHDFDMARFLAGSEPAEIYAIGDALINQDITQYDDIDTAIILIKFENGAMAVIDNSRQAAYGYDQRIEVFGSKGMVKCENNTPTQTTLFTNDGVGSDKPLYFFLERYQKSFEEELAAFFDAVDKGQETPVVGKDGLVSLKMAVAAKKSLNEKRPVSLSEIA